MSTRAHDWVWKHSPYKGTRFTIHLAIADVVRDSEDNTFSLSTSEIADAAHCGRSAVVASLTAMIKDQTIEVVDRAAGAPTKYRLVIPRARQRDRESRTPPSRVRADRAGVIADRAAVSSRALARSTPSNQELLLTQEQQLLVDELSLTDRRPVEVVFDAWVESTGRRAASTKLTDKRRRCIAAALKSYGLEDVIAAVRGWRNSPFHAGDNDRGEVYNELTLLLRDGERIEKFRDLYRAGVIAKPRRLTRNEQAVMNVLNQTQGDDDGQDRGGAPVLEADRRVPEHTDR